MTTANGYSINVNELVVRLGDFTIHDGLSLQVHNGEITSVVGASGTGKSVLLKTIIGLIKPVKGTIEILGQDYSQLSSRDAHEVRRRCGVLFQDGALFGSLTVNENIQVPIREHFKLSRQTRAELSALKLSMVGLDADVGNKYPSELSGGMRKRVGLARALALDPELLFLDEPTAGLDPIGAAAFDELLLELQENLHLTVFIVTHDLDTIYRVSNRIAVLGEKKLLISGTIDQVRSYEHPWVQDYFHGQRSRAVNH
jgi:phospholipid/cholesterol/gamma-HCH transport system ATP-binding protein